MRQRSGPGQWLRDHPYVVDGSVAAAATLAGLLGMQVTEYFGVQLRGPDVWAVLLNVAVAAPLVVRRKYPLTVALVIAAAYYTQGFTDYNSSAGGFTVLFAVYNLGAHARVLPSLLLVLAEAIGSVVYVVTRPEMLVAVGLDPGPLFLALTVAQFPGVWLIGRAMRVRRGYLVELEDRAERLESSAAAEVRAALAEERARVARELHDVVAHHVSVMTVQAAAARRTLQRDPERSMEAMLAVESTGRSALDEMRRIVGALRTADESEPAAADGRAPQAGVHELPDLLNRATEAGLNVDLTTVGETRPLPPSVDLAVYRVVQEALTNTLKHAGPTSARVLLRYEPAAVAVIVTDDGRGEARRRNRPEPSARRPGHGLIGMRERVNLNRGTLKTGHRTIGGFEVSAWLPYDPAVPDDTVAEDRTDRPEALPS